MKTCKMGCGKMKSGGTIKKVKKMAKGGAASANFGYPLNGLPMRPTNGNTDISKNQMGTNPTMKLGGSKDENCWPGKPGCGYKKAQRVNKRRSNANKVGPVLKKIGTAVGALGAGALAYTKNVGGIKDKIQGLKEQKMGGTTRKMSKGGIMKVGGYPPDGGDKRAEINKKLNGQKNNSKNNNGNSQNNSENSQNSTEKNYSTMSRKDYRAEKKGAKREAKLEAIRSGVRGERAVKVAEAIGNTANAVNTVVGAATDARNMFQRQKRGGAVKKMSKGGALKPVSAGKVGLSKLPTAVRNKMGYQKKGGSVKKK